jgi:hypothetical protein
VGCRIVKVVKMVRLSGVSRLTRVRGTVLLTHSGIHDRCQGDGSVDTFSVSRRCQGDECQGDTCQGDGSLDTFRQVSRGRFS